ncbi:UNVERIFIED_CONTAM: hypothetical protein GTU68_036777 [Idotea baltica]|nr:hypothetical protein [Idotea baltica]
MSIPSNWPLVIEPKDLAACLNDPHIKIIDLAQSKRYLTRHIPGALLVEPEETQLGISPAPGLRPTHKQTQILFQKLGHAQNTIYVVYDDEGGGWAGRFIWLLDNIGHTKYHYLNGGLRAWTNENYPLSDQIYLTALPSQVEPICFTDQYNVDLSYLARNLKKTDLVIWDARSEQEYNGIRNLSAKTGHIPGAVNFEWTQAMDKDNSLRILKNIADLLELRGITPDKEVIVHCQSHHRSGFAYLVLKHLNYKKVKAYPGSWSEWGNHPATPTEY